MSIEKDKSAVIEGEKERRRLNRVFKVLVVTLLLLFVFEIADKFMSSQVIIRFAKLRLVFIWNFGHYRVELD